MNKKQENNTFLIKKKTGPICISLCLLGINCRYDGKNNKNKKIINLSKDAILIPICPEQLGGLSTPRAPSEIQDGTGSEVLEGKARVMNKRGEDVTKEFLKGAYESLKIAKFYNIKIAILKSKSPSCGKGEIYDGSFLNKLSTGNGVTAELFLRNKIKVLTEKEI